MAVDLPQRRPRPGRLKAGRNNLFRAALACLFLLTAPGALANEARWQAVIPDYAAFPPRLIAVDKDRQQLFVYEKQSPLQLVRAFTCTTGQARGDKFSEGDLKTPEGIYFVERKIGSGLDFVKYGKEAYTLNYPNPVDRLRQKSGYGIWIHGRGEPLVPLQTEGCVAMNNGDMAMLGKILVPGTPVALAGSVFHQEDAGEHKAKAVRLEERVKDWASAWAGRSTSMFDFYDQESYSIATEPFSVFSEQKKRLFKSLKWIKIKVSDIQVLQGPGYWVTWFYQEYEAPNLTAAGVRRLYWSEDDKGEFRIIAMEWAPRQRPVLLASADSSHLRPKGAETVSDAGASGLVTAEAPASAVPAEGVPAEVPAAAVPGEVPASGGQSVADFGKAATGKGLEEPPAGDGRAETVLSAGVVTAQSLDLARGQSSGSVRVPLAEEDAAKEKAKGPDAATLERERKLAEVRAMSEARAEGGKESLRSGRSATEETAPQADRSEKAERENTVQEASAFVENWRKAWLSGDADKYMVFYAKDAVQGSRKGKEAIRNQKRRIWRGDTRPGRIELVGIRVSVADGRVMVDMQQTYWDKGGKSDVGIKSLTLVRKDGGFYITREDWKPLEDASN